LRKAHRFRGGCLRPLRAWGRRETTATTSLRLA